jgi:hypothetical protein
MTEDDDGEEHALDRSFAGQAAAMERARKMRLLRRIADALQAPDATLHGTTNPPIRFETAPSRNEADLDGECGALLQAYRLIQDPKTRQRLLALVEEAAERT